MFLVNDRHPEIGKDERQSPTEFLRRYAQDGERMLVQLDRAAHYAAVILKMAVPIGVSEHDIRSAVRAALVRCVNETAEIRLNV
jgi:hypothetical protein